MFLKQSKKTEKNSNKQQFCTAAEGKKSVGQTKNDAHELHLPKARCVPAVRSDGRGTRPAAGRSLRGRPRGAATPRRGRWGPAGGLPGAGAPFPAGQPRPLAAPASPAPQRVDRDAAALASVVGHRSGLLVCSYGLSPKSSELRARYEGEGQDPHLQSRGGTPPK